MQRKHSGSADGKKVIDLKKLWKNDYFKTALAIVLIIAIVAGFFFGIATGSWDSWFQSELWKAAACAFPMTGHVMAGSH